MHYFMFFLSSTMERKGRGERRRAGGEGVEGRMRMGHGGGGCLRHGGSGRLREAGDGGGGSRGSVVHLFLRFPSSTADREDGRWEATTPPLSYLHPQPLLHPHRPPPPPPFLKHALYVLNSHPGAGS